MNWGLIDAPGAMFGMASLETSGVRPWTSKWRIHPTRGRKSTSAAFRNPEGAKPPASNKSPEVTGLTATQGLLETPLQVDEPQWAASKGAHGTHLRMNTRPPLACYGCGWQLARPHHYHPQSFSAWIPMRLSCASAWTCFDCNDIIAGYQALSH